MFSIYSDEVSRSSCRFENYASLFIRRVFKFFPPLVWAVWFCSWFFNLRFILIHKAWRILVRLIDWIWFLFVWRLYQFLWIFERFAWFIFLFIKSILISGVEWDSRNIILILTLVSGSIIWTFTLLRSTFSLFLFCAYIWPASIFHISFIVVFKLWFTNSQRILFKTFLLFVYWKSWRDSVLTWNDVIFIAFIGFSTLNSLTSFIMYFDRFKTLRGRNHWVFIILMRNWRFLINRITWKLWVNKPVIVWDSYHGLFSR